VPNKNTRNSFRLLKNIAACGVCIFICLGSSGQKKLLITVSPAFLQVNTIAIQPGVEYHFSGKWAILTELALPIASESQIGKAHLF